MMLRAVIFDLDGVIVDSHPTHKQAWKAFLISIGKEVTEQELEFVMEGQKREAILRHFLGDLTAQEVKHYGGLKDALLKDSLPEPKTVNGLDRFMEQVKDSGLPMAVASSASRSRVKLVLAQLNLTSSFQVVITGDDVTLGKPDPKIFRMAAKALDVEAHNILVCEDAVSGVEAAKAAGMKCLAIAANGRGPILEKAGADLIMTDFTAANLEELRKLFAVGSNNRPPLTEEEIRTLTIGELKPLSCRILIADYDPQWPELFRREADRIRDTLGRWALRIEHTGSTSVPGLVAKPIIDVLLVVTDSADENAYVPTLEAAGYLLHIRESNWYEHRMFKGPDTETNLHVFSAGCPEIDRMLMFRDWLRSNADDRDLYARTKLSLAQKEWTYVQNYADAKTVVIEEIIARARADRK
jgi:HAD superfamily hydrolase (TIGR01549 family)